ncbi:MAG: hypothetical protein K9W43_11020 [Candidatus Thorarchaeota archaeon]|nr:hypothetical protein [Candidatus Thorarchaeota archaeon]
MRIKAVLRDTTILGMEPGSRERVIAAAQKNTNRIVNLHSLLKIMGLKLSDRVQVLEILEKEHLSIWLANEGDQHVIYLSDGTPPDDPDFSGYRWI